MRRASAAVVIVLVLLAAGAGYLAGSHGRAASRPAADPELANVCLRYAGAVARLEDSAARDVSRLAAELSGMNNVVGLACVPRHLRGRERNDAIDSWGSAADECLRMLLEAPTAATGCARLANLAERFGDEIRRAQ